MNVKFQKVRDPETHRLAGIYCQAEGTFEIRQKGRVMQIQIPPGTPIEFIFDNSDPAA